MSSVRPAFLLLVPGRHMTCQMRGELQAILSAYAAALCITVHTVHPTLNYIQVWPMAVPPLPELCKRRCLTAAAAAAARSYNNTHCRHMQGPCCMINTTSLSCTRPHRRRHRLHAWLCEWRRAADETAATRPLLLPLLLLGVRSALQPRREPPQLNQRRRLGRKGPARPVPMPRVRLRARTHGCMQAAAAEGDMGRGGGGTGAAVSHTRL